MTSIQTNTWRTWRSLRICGQAAVICGQDSIFLLIVLEHVIGIPPIRLMWKQQQRQNLTISMWTNLNALDHMKQTLCFGWIYSKFSTSLFLVSDTFLTTSVSRDSRLSELWVSPPSQGSRSFSLCSPLIRPVTAASVKLSETWRKECIYLCTAWYHTHACTHAGSTLTA